MQRLILAVLTTATLIVCAGSNPGAVHGATNFDRLRDENRDKAAKVNFDRLQPENRDKTLTRR